MASGHAPRKAPLLTSALVLTIFAVTGLMTGLLTRTVANAAAPDHTPTSANAMPSPTPVATTTPDPTATGAPTSAANASQFGVSIGVSGQQHPSQTLEVSASALSADSGAPVVGVRCVLGPDATGQSLLATWPDATTTDAAGKCGWSITIPAQTAPGAYRLRVDGYSAQYHAWAFATVHVS